MNAPTDDPTMAEVTFYSSNLTLDGKDEMASTCPQGTIGFGMFPDVPTQAATTTNSLPNPPPLKGHLHMFERVTRAKSKLALSVRASLHAMASKSVPRTEENPTLAQASKSADWIHWQEAIGKELDMLKHMQSYDLILRSQVPKGRQFLQSKMDLKTKKDAMGRITKRKARLVALGNLEWETIRDTYAPTVNAKTINLMLALSAQECMILYGLDVTGAFLNADIGETVYIELPERLRPRTAAGEEQVWQLKKTLYGLNRAPKAFYDDMATHLLSHDYKRSPLDPCLFHKIAGGRKIIFCVHVDDFAIAATHQDLIDDLCRTLQLRYQITESDNLESFLGIHILKDKDTLYLHSRGISPRSSPQRTSATSPR